jgi:hypothetical protein
VAGRREKPLTLVEAYGFWINARFERQFTNEHETAGMAFFTTRLMLFEFDRDYRPGWSIHLQQSPRIYRYFLNALNRILMNSWTLPPCSRQCPA